MQFRRGLADCDLMAGAYEMLAAPVVDRPDQWWAIPARLRTVHTGQ